MLIKDIRFRRIRKLAKKRLEQFTARWDKGKRIVDDFDWGATPEQHKFWSLINREKYSLAFKLRPDLFRPTKKEIKEAYKFNRLIKKANFIHHCFAAHIHTK